MNTKGLLVGLTLAATGTAHAATVFAPTDGDVNFLLSSIDPGYGLYMFDDGISDFNSATGLAVPLPSIVGISGPSGGGTDHIATNTNNQTLTLLNDDQFILAVNNGGSLWVTDTAVTSAGSNAFNVTFGTTGVVLEVDVEKIGEITDPSGVVPVPAAVWLFGSGLLGLVGVARRRAG